MMPSGGVSVRIPLLATDVAGKEVEVIRPCTLVEPRFPIGVWQSSSDFRTHEYRQELSEARIDAPFLGLRPESYPDEFFEKYGFVPMGNPRPLVGDELKPEFEQEILLIFLGVHQKNKKYLMSSKNMAIASVSLPTTRLKNRIGINPKLHIQLL